MSREQLDLDARVRTWLDDGAEQAPERFVWAALDQIETVPQRRRRWPLLERIIMSTKTVAPFLGVTAAALVLVVAGMYLTSRAPAPPTGGPDESAPALPSASSDLTPTPSPSALCGTSEPECTGLELQPGTHTTGHIVTPFSFTIPEGWLKRDLAGAINLEPVDALGRLIAVWPDPVIAQQDPCTKGVEPGVGHTVDDLVAWLTQHPGLQATEPVPVTIGGLDGVTFDLRMASGYEAPCAGLINLFVHDERMPDPFWWEIRATTAMRLSFLEAGDGRVVLVDVQSDADVFDEFVEEATPIVDSFDFLAAP